MATAKKAPKAPAPARKLPTKKAAPKARAEKGQAPPARPAPARATAAVKAVKSEKPRKPRLVRDSFTIPKAEYTVLEELKKRLAALGTPAKKSELLRAGIKALAGMGDAALTGALAAVPAIKTGRPAKD